LSFGNFDTVSNHIFQSLIQPAECDDIVCAILKVVLSGICKTFQHLFADFINDGKWKMMRTDDELRQKTISVPKHNKFSETIFGHLDRLLREKPNIKLLANESYIMFVHNKTLDWLAGKTDNEKEILLSKARKNVSTIRLKFKERMKQLEIKRRLNLEEKLRKAENVEKKEFKSYKIIPVKLSLGDYGNQRSK